MYKNCSASDRIIYSNNIELVKPGIVLHWMDRDMRIDDNYAFLYAQHLAQESRSSLLVVYNLVLNFENGSARQWHFKIGALKELKKKCSDLNIGFQIIIEHTKGQTLEKLSQIITNLNITAVVTDFSPLRIQRQWKESISKKCTEKNIPFSIIDAHNIVPVTKASTKQEFAAYTFRKKINPLLPEFLLEYPKVKRHPHSINLTKHERALFDTHDWEKIKNTKGVNNDALPITWVMPGEKSARKQLDFFIKNGLMHYADKRNDPLSLAQSNLSPYLHYGMIAPGRVTLEVMRYVHELSGSSADFDNARIDLINKLFAKDKNSAKIEAEVEPTIIDHARAFLEELVVRRELADNFCYYNLNYDTTKCFPDWSSKTLRKHQSDPRQYTYTQLQFEKAQTHDDLWNAAQLEMVNTGKMHGYMRMYWAKKILEWSKSADDAMQIAIYLNDKYELDGRDSNGYVGIAWSIGGVHDRAWFPRPIFGTVRYMARSGCEKKFDVKAYIDKHGSSK